ncbi:hypothetical protein KM043_014617 [Ampulex compressa]|nr:hypothetical protein KM043_014617 [Ampulex compressa]
MLRKKLSQQQFRNTDNERIKESREICSGGSFLSSFKDTLITGELRRCGWDPAGSGWRGWKRKRGRLAIAGRVKRGPKTGPRSGMHQESSRLTARNVET